MRSVRREAGERVLEDEVDCEYEAAFSSSTLFVGVKGRKRKIGVGEVRSRRKCRSSKNRSIRKSIRLSTVLPLPLEV